MTDVDLRIPDLAPNNTTSAQDIAALGALLTSAGMTKLQVQALMARIRTVAETVAMVTLNDTLEEIRKIQESRMWRLTNMIQAMSTVGGYVNRNSVLMAVNTVMTETPRQ
jgi:nucleoside recognition membrane protein YjiH